MYFQEPWGNIILNLTGTNCAKNYLLPHKTSHHMEILIVLDQFINNVQQKKKKKEIIFLPENSSSRTKKCAETSEERN
jgi:peptidase E